jgi:hypothetical protein
VFFSSVPLLYDSIVFFFFLEGAGLFWVVDALGGEFYCFWIMIWGVFWRKDGRGWRELRTCALGG